MNPIVTILASALFTGAVGVMVTQDPEVDTWGLVSASTAYSPVEAGTPPVSDTRQDAPIALYEGPGCAEWADAALRGGFQPHDLSTALQVMELESGCLPGAIGDNGQSFGLMQINDYWCTPNQYWPRGYLQTQAILDDCAELLDPLTNLWAAWHISSRHGWQNWTTYARISQ